VKAKSLLRCLGEEVRARRTRLELSQEALAHLAGIHPNVVGRLERGTYNPTVLTLYALAVKLDTELSDLFAATEGRQ
jgi:transcriptional regulator with XRE-family HTH domain